MTDLFLNTYKGYSPKEAGASSQLLKQLASGARKPGVLGSIKNFLRPGSSSFITYDGKDLTRRVIDKMSLAQKRQLIKDMRAQGDYFANSFSANSGFSPYLQANRAAEFYSRTLRNPNSYLTWQKDFQAAQNAEYLKAMYKYRDAEKVFKAYNSLAKGTPKRAKALEKYRKALKAYRYQAERAGQVSDAVRRQNLFMPVKGQLDTNTLSHTVNNPQFRSSGQTYTFNTAQIANNQFSVPGVEK